MPIAHRRPGLFHLVLPHPALDQPATPSPASPHTPRRARPDSTHNRSSVASDRPPRSSIDSWNSVDTNELVWEWKDEELELLSRTLDNIPSHLMTPYVGVIPPPNVLDKLARNIALSRNALEWPHSVRATRVKLHELCRRKTVQKAIERHAPVTRVEPASGSGRRPLYRQSSMDFLPVKDEATSVTRLSSRLHRADRTAPHASFHPYARPDSRTPSPPPAEPPNRPTTRSTTESPIRAPSPRKLFRSSVTPPSESHKRAPSSSTKTRSQSSPSSAPPESPRYSSDEDEKARQKRPRTTRRVPSFLGAPLPELAPSPEEEILDPLVVVPDDLVFAPTIPVKRTPAPRQAAASSRSGASTPAPQTRATPTPVTSTPRTLRRVGTRNFPPPASAAALARAVALSIPPVVVSPQPARASVPSQPRRTSSSQALPSTSDEQRRRERKSHREHDKESQPQSESSRRSRSKPLPKEPKPTLSSMRL